MTTTKFTLFFHIFHLTFTFFALSEGAKSHSNKLNYTLTTKLVHSMSLQDSFINIDKHSNRKYFEKQQTIKKHIKHIKSTPTLPKLHKSVNNLYSILNTLINDNCLIAINNFEGIDINPTIAFPVILKQFELGVGQVKYFHPIYKQFNSEIDVLWIPSNKVVKLNGNVSSDIFNEYSWWSCSILKYLYSLWPPDKYSSCCHRSKSFNFILSSRPWQCEIQVDLYMPDGLLPFGKNTEIFDNLVTRHSNIVPSLRSPVHILVDTKSNFEDYDGVALAAWTARRNTRFEENAKSSSINDVQLIAHVNCNYNSETLKLNLNCNLETFNVVFLCPECKHFLIAYPMEFQNLSLKELARIDIAQKYVAFPGKIAASETLKLGGQIVHYINYEPEAIKLPLKHMLKQNTKFSDKLQMLGFAFASIFVSFMGNLTVDTPAGFQIPEYEYFTMYLERNGKIVDVEYKVYHDAIRVPNLFGQLHFVSCGSRGTEPFPFVQFVSIFEWEVWLLILISISLLAITIFRLNGKKSSSNSF